MGQIKGTSKPQQGKQQDILLPSYTVRESQKAKHVRLKISVQDGLEVTIPQGFNQEKIPEILRQKQKWIDKTNQQLEAQRQHLQLEPPEKLPERILLGAIAEDWQVQYMLTPASGVTLSENSELQLLICGNIHSTETCKAALRKWLSHKAHTHLAPWLQTVSCSIQLPFGKISVRGQKTRWASCSSCKDISLNYKLLFLPKHLVHYVFVHELCHTVHMNHSAKFWALVAEKEPSYKQSDTELHQAWCYIPGWVEPTV